jgi:hypothetical protein
MALKTIRCYADASSPERRSALRAIHTFNSPKKYIRKLGGLSTIHSKHRNGAQGLMWGARGGISAGGGHGCGGCDASCVM